MGIAGSDMYCNEAIAFFNNIKINKEYFYNILKYTNYDKQKHLFNSQIGKAFNKSTLAKVLLYVPSPEDQEKVVAMIQAINNEESEFNNCIKSLKSTITNLYYCVEQYTKGEAVVNNMDGDNDDDEQEENEEEPEIELERVEIKGNTYLSDGCNTVIINSVLL